MSWKPFKTWMRKQYRESTYKEYYWRIDRFLKDNNVNSPEDLQRIKLSDVMTWIGNIEERGVTQTGVYAYALKALLEFYDLGTIASKIPTPRGHVLSSPKWLPEPIIMLLLEVADTSRVKALAALGYDLALRMGEALLLNVTPKPDTAYIDVDSGTANVYRLKTRQYPWQLLQVSEFALQAVRAWMRERPDTSDALFSTSAIFPGTKGGGRIHASWAEKLWREWMTSIGLTYDFKVLRHSKLTWMAAEGKDLTEIAKFAGHTTPNPTLVYVHLASQYLKRPEIFLEELKGSVIYERAVRAMRQVATVKQVS